MLVSNHSFDGSRLYIYIYIGNKKLFRNMEYKKDLFGKSE